MKKLKTIFATMMLCFGLVATMSSCSEDDDEPATPAARYVAGTYSGDMTCSVMGSESVFEDMTFSVAAIDDATVDVVIPSFGNPPMQVPEITVTGVNVSGADGTYTLAPAEFKGTTDAGKAYSGSIQGSFENDEITIRFSLQYGAMPMPMICTFTAPKK